MMCMFNAERRKPTGFRMCLPAAQALQKQCEVLAEENEEAVGSSACCILLKHTEAASQQNMSIRACQDFDATSLILINI